jgi:hypothetical protein
LADTPTPSPGKTEGFDFSPNHLTAEDYKVILAQREEFVKQQLAASNEFMYQHYTRLIRAVEKSYERATKANIVLERKQRRTETNRRREALKGQKQARH